MANFISQTLKSWYQCSNLLLSNSIFSE